MRLPYPIRLPRVLAVILCVVAMTVFSFLPPPAEACFDCNCECKIAGFAYSEGACANNQTCMCIHYETSCSCRWVAGCS
jgi:hypothetical protein